VTFLLYFVCEMICMAGCTIKLITVEHVGASIKIFCLLFYAVVLQIQQAASHPKSMCVAHYFPHHSILDRPHPTDVSVNVALQKLWSKSSAHLCVLNILTSSSILTGVATSTSSITSDGCHLLVCLHVADCCQLSSQCLWYAHMYSLAHLLNFCMRSVVSTSRDRLFLTVFMNPSFPLFSAIGVRWY